MKTKGDPTLHQKNNSKIRSLDHDYRMLKHSGPLAPFYEGFYARTEKAMERNIVAEKQSLEQLIEQERDDQRKFSDPKMLKSYMSELEYSEDFEHEIEMSEAILLDEIMSELLTFRNDLKPAKKKKSKAKKKKARRS
ncbi:MAG: hypothetical protein R3B45_09610 [Bdellovibrionota bacterium]